MAMASNVETDEQRQERLLEREESETDLEERGKLTKKDKHG